MNGKTIVVVLAAAGVLGGSALAQGDGGRKDRRPRGAGGLADFVGLTAEQRERFETLRAEHQKEIEPMRSEGRELHEKLRSALEATNPDPQAVGTAMIAVRQHGEKMKASAEAFRSRMKSELTPEQQQKLDAFEAARGVGRGRHGRGAPGGPAFEEDVDGPPPF